MKKNSRVVTVEYVVQDCPICGKVIVKHYLDNGGKDNPKREVKRDSR